MLSPTDETRLWIDTILFLDTFRSCLRDAACQKSAEYFFLGVRLFSGPFF